MDHAQPRYKVAGRWFDDLKFARMFADKIAADTQAPTGIYDASGDICGLSLPDKANERLDA